MLILLYLNITTADVDVAITSTLAVIPTTTSTTTCNNNNNNNNNIIIIHTFRDLSKNLPYF